MIRRLAGVVSLLTLAAPTALWAHSPIDGLGDFANGLLHPIFVPFHLLASVAIGLLIGQQNGKDLARGMSCLLAGIVIGLGFSDSLTDMRHLAEPSLLYLSLIIGLLVTLGKPVGLLAGGLLATLTGLLLGIDSGPETLNGGAALAAMLGSGIGLYAISVYAMALSDRLTQALWQRIGIRIAGSWVAAAALLVLALTFRTV